MKSPQSLSTDFRQDLHSLAKLEPSIPQTFDGTHDQIQPLQTQKNQRGHFTVIQVQLKGKHQQASLKEHGSISFTLVENVEFDKHHNDNEINPLEVEESELGLQEEVDMEAV